MPIPPDLPRRLHEALGPETAGPMVEWMQEQDRTSRDWALRSDVAELRHEMHREVEAVRHEMQLGFAAVREDMARMEGRIGALLERRIGDLMKWSFVFWVGAVSAIAMLAGVLD